MLEHLEPDALLDVVNETYKCWVSIPKPCPADWIPPQAARMSASRMVTPAGFVAVPYYYCQYPAGSDGSGSSITHLGNEAFVGDDRSSESDLVSTGNISQVILRGYELHTHSAAAEKEAKRHMSAAFLNTTQVLLQLKSSNGDFMITSLPISLLNSFSFISMSCFSSVGESGTSVLPAGRISSFEPVLGGVYETG